MKKIAKSGLALAVILGLGLSSCSKKGCIDLGATNYDSEAKKDDGSCVFPTSQAIVSNITENTTWTNDKVWILGGRITVLSGVTLTIEAGTIIKGEAGAGANATALLIARGGKLMAEGTATAPIIFTTIADEITPELLATGNFASPNLAPDVNGLWGGIIVLGKARISASNDNGDISEIQIDGIPTSDPNGLYGGNDDTDNSGILKYISIRHGGTNIGAGNEINGLTLGGVGNKTIIENIEVVGNQDDGIEWFGGSVNVTNAVVWNAGDDAIDGDQSWSGTLDNFVVIAPSDHNFELDGPEGSFEAGYTIKNGSIIANVGDRKSSDLINVDQNTACHLENLYFTGISDNQKVNISKGDSLYLAPDVTFKNIQLNVVADSLQNHVAGTIPAEIKAVSAKSTGADLSKLTWTWASQSGAFTGL